MRRTARGVLLTVVATTLAGTGALAIDSGAADDPAPLGFTASYTVYAAGLHALDVEFDTALATERFTARMTARAHGAVGKLFPWEMEAASSGIRDASQLRPERHRNASRLRDDARWMEIEFAGDRPLATRGEPAEDGDPWHGIPREALPGALDPISAVSAILTSETGDILCRPRVPVFDGKRLFDIELDPLPPRQLKSRAGRYGGPVTGCRVMLKQVAGKGDIKDVSSVPITAWFADLHGAGLTVPVRIEIRTKLGHALAHLSHLRLADGTVVFDGSEAAPDDRQSARRR